MTTPNGVPTTGIASVNGHVDPASAERIQIVDDEKTFTLVPFGLMAA